MDPITGTIRKVKETLSRHGMIDPGDLVIVGVSGGPDSVCLLDILHQLKDDLMMELVVAHYDHGLRQEEDEGETQFVRQLASSMGLPFETEKGSLFRRGGSGSIEEKARDARYEYLQRMRHKYNGEKIAVGHHLNDQAETVLMRLLRGSGPSGLTGIPPCRDETIVRPLIEIKRATIESYLGARDLPYVTDSSNLETRYLRNKIRLELLPAMLKDQPRFVEHLGQLAILLGEDNEYLEREAEKWIKREAQRINDAALLIPVPRFLQLPPSIEKRVVRQLLRKIGRGLRRIDQCHIRSVHNLAMGSKPQSLINLPNELTVRKIYDRLIFVTGKPQEALAFQYVLEGPGTFHLEEIGQSISLVEVDGQMDPASADSSKEAYLDAGKLQYPLFIRNFRPGDRFIPLGMKGHKKIKDFFMDLKIPSSQRRSIPILFSQDKPAWICGYRIDDRFKVTPETERILKVTLK